MSILSQQKQSVNTDFPNLRPSLDLRFALAKKLDPRITFTRGSTGTYFGPDGIMRTAGVNEPRFDHDPITGQSLGLLVEESRTNLWTSSESTILTGSGFTNNVSLPTGVVNPAGGTTATLINTGNTQTWWSSGSGDLSFNIGYYIMSWWAYTTVESVNFGTSDYFNLSNSTISSQTIATPGRWTRCFRVSYFANSGNAQVRFMNYNSTLYTNTNNKVFIWGAQLEYSASTSAVMTSYIPTAGSQVTRSADLASMTGTNFSSWYNSTEGTFVVSTRQPEFYGQDIIGLGSGTGSIYRGGSGTVEWWNGSKLLITSNTASWRVGIKVAGSYNSTTRYLCLNGGPIASNPTTLPNGGLMRIGRVFNGTEGSNGTISRITYYPIQLTNQQMINLTS